MTLVIRSAVAEDAAHIAALAQSAYRGEASRRGWTTEADLLDGQRIDAAMVGDLVARPHSAILLACEGERELVACVHVEARGEAAHLGLFAVSPERQGSGLGRRLLAYAEGYVRRTWGAAVVELDVIHQRGELIAWYERRGYRLTGTTAPFPAHDPRFGRPRAADLHFVTLAKRLAP